MSEKIEPTWLAYALERGADPDALRQGVRRVAEHYTELVDYPLRAEHRLGPRTGLAIVGDAEPPGRWRHFAGAEDAAIATAYIPTGWERVVGPVSPADAAEPLRDAVLDDPHRVVRELNAPAVIGALRGERLVVVNDAIGAGRLYALEIAGGRVWSNRAGALFLFAGERPQASERGWRIFVAASWWIADATAFANVRKVGRGTVIEAGPDGVREERTEALAPLVTGSDAALDELVAATARQAKEQVATAASLWPETVKVDLSGGRDSRLVAAAAVAAGIDARFTTSDQTPGEADVARQLVEAAPRAMRHRVTKDEEGFTPATPLLRRALNVHLLHDSMRHAQKLRGNVKLPRSRPDAARLSGHGGEIAHGFFYKDARQLRGLRLTGRRGLSKRLLRFFTKEHHAARPEAYGLAREEIARSLDEGRELGIGGPTLLEWFYLTERFAHRSGLASHAERVSVFATPAFIRAAFALDPRQRVDAVLHRRVIAMLVPEWDEIPFFKAERRRQPRVRRRRLWEDPEDAAAVEAIIAADGPWTDLWRPDHVRSAWRDARAGETKGNVEQVFEAIAFRHAFEDYLELIGDRAARGAGVAR